MVNILKFTKGLVRCHQFCLAFLCVWSVVVVIVVLALDMVFGNYYI